MLWGLVLSGCGAVPPCLGDCVGSAALEGQSAALGDWLGPPCGGPATGPETVAPGAGCIDGLCLGAARAEAVDQLGAPAGCAVAPDRVSAWCSWPDRGLAARYALAFDTGTVAPDGEAWTVVATPDHPGRSAGGLAPGQSLRCGAELATPTQISTGSSGLLVAAAGSAAPPGDAPPLWIEVAEGGGRLVVVGAVDIEGLDLPALEPGRARALLIGER